MPKKKKKYLVNHLGNVLLISSICGQPGTSSINALTFQAIRQHLCETQLRLFHATVTIYYIIDLFRIYNLLKARRICCHTIFAAFVCLLNNILAALQKRRLPKAICKRVCQKIVPNTYIYIDICICIYIQGDYTLTSNEATTDPSDFFSIQMTDTVHQPHKSELQQLEMRHDANGLVLYNMYI